MSSKDTIMQIRSHFQSLLTLIVALSVGTNGFAQSPAEREAQRLVPRTPGNWPEALKRPGTALSSPVADTVNSAYCKSTRFYAKPADGYIQYITDYETCVEPTIHDNPPFALSSLEFEELCHAAAFVRSPNPGPGMVIARWIFSCTLEKFTDNKVQISISENYNYNNPNGACYNDPLAICGRSIRSNMRTTCVLAVTEPVSTWDCFKDGIKTLATNDRRTESLPDFSNPVPTDVASQEALVQLILEHVTSKLH
jgi:hypothetical protein